MGGLNTIGKFTEMQKIEIKILMLEIFGEALKAGSITEQGDMFRKLVREL